MRPLHIAAGGLVLLLAAGCASGPDTPSPRQQIVATLKTAFDNLRVRPAVTAALTETVESGTDPVAQGKGNLTLDLAHGAGETRMTVNGSATVVAVRRRDTFYEAKTQAALSSTGRSLVAQGRSDPSMLPQVQAPGLDPLQLTTLLSAVSWPDAVVGAEPVLTSDPSGQHTEYQVLISTAKLASHLAPADRTWLDYLAHQPDGRQINVTASVTGGHLSSLSAQFPIPRPRSFTNVGKQLPAGLPSPAPMTVLVAETFSYTAHPAAVPTPA